MNMPPKADPHTTVLHRHLDAYLIVIAALFFVLVLAQSAHYRTHREQSRAIIQKAG